MNNFTGFPSSTQTFGSNASENLIPLELGDRIEQLKREVTDSKTYDISSRTAVIISTPFLLVGVVIAKNACEMYIDASKSTGQLDFFSLIFQVFAICVLAIDIPVCYAIIKRVNDITLDRSVTLKRLNDPTFIIFLRTNNSFPTLGNLKDLYQSFELQNKSSYRVRQ